MLLENKIIKLKDTLKEFSKEEIIWVNGYLSGLLENYNINTESAVVSAKVSVKPTIIYGTETGNSKKVALELQTAFKKQKIQSKLVDAAQYSIENLTKESFLIVIMSTQGEGEPPQAAQKFYDNLHNSSENLSKLQFAVFGLGDTSYPLFCKASEDINLQLEKLGAQRIISLQKADVDFQPVATSWVENLLNSIQNIGLQEPKIATLATSITHEKKTFTGKVKENIILNDNGSNKEVHHIEIESNDEVFYEPGDALGIYPQNSDEDILNLQTYFKNEISIEKWKSLNIRGLSKKSLEKIGEILKIEIKVEKANLVDILNQYVSKNILEPQEIEAVLHQVTPRLYSISSSKEYHEGQVHLTVALDRFELNGQEKVGFASNYLSYFNIGQEFEFYIHKNQNFRLPQEDQDIIMIGPGTGIAPFRSFLAERDATAASGKNWLFFGEQHFTTDFYYQTEIQEWLSTGLITHFDAAFSRDQEQKVYVQNRMKQKGKLLNEWLENGASIYVCGQKNPMSIDVEQTLVEIIAENRNISHEIAKKELEKLQDQGKYNKDVY